MRLVCLFVLLAASAVAQNPAPPAFAVASVKINAQFDPSNRSTSVVAEDVHPGSVSLRNFSLTMLVAWAYNTQRPAVVAPDWSESVRYDVIAKSDELAKEPVLRRMMQTLLAERFHLTFHRESRQMDAFLLQVARTGTKMKPSKAVESKSRADEELGMVIEGATVAEIAEDFSHDLAAPVVDGTGLTGRFDFSMNPGKYVADMREKVRGMPGPVHGDELKLALIENILQGDLGLRIEPRRTAVEVLVIDHADKTPVEN